MKSTTVDSTVDFGSVARKSSRSRRSMNLVKSCGTRTSSGNIGPDAKIWYNGRNGKYRKLLRKRGEEVVGTVDKVVLESGKVACSFSTPDGEGGFNVHSFLLDRSCVSVVSV